MAAPTILVADDDGAIRTVVSQALGRAGYEVRATGNAATLWRWVSDGDGDIVITDVIMPDENGLDLVPRIRGVLLLTAIMNGWVFPFQTLVPVFARDVLGTSPLGLGVLAGSFGIGVLVGLGFVHWGRKHVSDPVLYVAGCLLCAVAVLCFSFSSLFSLSLVLMVVAGIGQAGFSTMQSGIVLTDSSDDMRGRVMAVVILAIGGGLLGNLQCAAMVAALGAPLTVAIMSLSAVISTVAVAVLSPGFFRKGER